jgi:cyclopropane fatty-acyl-phospholipid synthase-like methyltransferase
MTPAAALVNSAARLYRRSGAFPFRFAQGKLRHDPVVVDILFLNCLSHASQSPIRLLDLGCGQGLLFAVMDASMRQMGGVPCKDGRAGQPAVAYARGYDVAPVNVRWGQSMLANRQQPNFQAQIEVADIRTLELPECDVVVAIDVLHYLSFGEQEKLLLRISEALAPGGRLVLRIGDAEQLRASRISRWVDRVVAKVRGQGWAPLWMRPLLDWQGVLQRLGFAVTQVKTYRSWGSVNVLVVADKCN